MRLIAPRHLLMLLVPLCLASPMLAIAIGSAQLEFADIISALWHGITGKAPASISERIIWELRLPRVLLAMLTGAGLAIAGSVLQMITRNPLADPYLFGVSSGASLGAVLAISSGISVAALSLPLSAFAGALIAVGLVMLIAASGQIERMILAGVAISFLFAALSSLVIYFSDAQSMQAVLFWNMGSFSRASWAILPLPTSVVLACSLAILFLSLIHI